MGFDLEDVRAHGGDGADRFDVLALVVDRPIARAPPVLKASSAPGQGNVAP